MTRQNQAALEGYAEGTPVLSHENHGIRFFRFLLRTPRLSGQSDWVPVLLPEALLPLPDGDGPIRAEGQFRSFNNRSGTGRRLVLSIYAKAIRPGTGTPCNQIFLSGTLCRPPVFRRTPLGRSICDLMIAAPRRYGRTDYLPAIAWGNLAVRTGRMETGDALSLEGRIQSRVYHKAVEGKTEARTAYEISIMRLLPEGEAPGHLPPEAGDPALPVQPL